MPKIKLKNEIKNEWIYRFSALISNFFNPLTSLVIYFIFYSVRNLTWNQAVQHFLPILILLIIPVSLWIIIKVRNGTYTNMDVSNRTQRKSLYRAIIALMAIYLGYTWLIENDFDYAMLFVFTLLILMQISNYFIKSSMHTALNVYAAALFFLQDIRWGIVWLLIAVAVGITRIILKRHTVAEVLMGGALGMAVGVSYLLFTKDFY